MPEGKRLSDQDRLTAFNNAVLPHLDAAYNLARWLTRNDQDAEDVVQEASLRAFKYWKGFSGGNCRSWLLAIVRNTYYSWLRQRSVQPELTEDGEIDEVDDGIPNPERALLQNADRDMLKAALEDLAVEFREAIVLREMEGLSYKETKDFLNAYVDGELDSAGSPAVETHIRACASCLTDVENLHALASAIENGSLRFKAPARLKRNVQGAIRAANPEVRSSVFYWRWASVLASAVLIIGLTWTVTTHRARSSEETLLVSDIVSSHVRSMMANHVTD